MIDIAYAVGTLLFISFLLILYIIYWFIKLGWAIHKKVGRIERGEDLMEIERHYSLGDKEL